MGGVNCLSLQRNIKKYRQMGLLDKNITITFLEGKVPLEDLFELLKEKLGSKYEVKFLKKGSTAAQFLGTGSAKCSTRKAAGLGSGLSEPYTVATKSLTPIYLTLSTANTLYSRKTKM